MNNGEWGVVFRLSTGFDMSSSTALSLAFTKPSGEVLTKTNPAVTVGSGNVSTTLGTFLSTKYVNYTFANGDVDEAGEWDVRLTYDDGTLHLISNPATFTINP